MLFWLVVVVLFLRVLSSSYSLLSLCFYIISWYYFFFCSVSVCWCTPPAFRIDHTYTMSVVCVCTHMPCPLNQSKLKTGPICSHWDATGTISTIGCENEEDHSTNGTEAFCVTISIYAHGARARAYKSMMYLFWLLSTAGRSDYVHIYVCMGMLCFDIIFTNSCLLCIMQKRPKWTRHFRVSAGFYSLSEEKEL